MKIGILTFHWATNYGAILQAYALQSYLEGQGHEVEIVNYKPTSHDLSFLNLLRNPKSWLHLNKYFKKKNKETLLAPFRTQYLHLTKRYSSCKELKEIAFRYEILISGSDQVLNPSFTLYGDRKRPTSVYYLSFASPQTKKIGYAVSFGCNIYPDNAAKYAKMWIKQFDSIGVREKTGLGIVTSLGFTKPAVLVPDPVVLYGKNVFNRLTLPSIEGKPYICVYFLRRELQLPASENYRIIDDVRSPITMEEWISTIACSKTLITNSFHGMVVALLNHVPFVIDIEGGRSKGMNDRFYTLLDCLNLTNRICGEQYSLSELLNIRKIDWEQVDRKLILVQKHGADYLKTVFDKSLAPTNIN